MTQIQNTISTHYVQLSSAERGQIEAFRSLEVPMSISEIARRLNRNKSTISREIRRGTTIQLGPKRRPYHKYLADTGEAIYHRNRSACHPQTRFEQCPDFYEQLAAALRQRPRIYSVDTFVHHYQSEHPDQPCPSTPTVYRDIDKGLLAVHNADLPMKLRRRVRHGNHHSRLNKKVLGTSIDERPAAVEDRQEVGHWEGDLVKGKRVEDEPALMTMTERKTRFEIIIKLPNYHADTCRKGLESILADYGADNFKTVTFDNGSEFAQLGTINGTQVYFAHPYSPWERGSNENANGLIREFIPKGRSLHEYDLIDIQSIQDTLNCRPRRLLDYQSASDLMPEL